MVGLVYTFGAQLIAEVFSFLPPQLLPTVSFGRINACNTVVISTFNFCIHSKEMVQMICLICYICVYVAIAVTPTTTTSPFFGPEISDLLHSEHNSSTPDLLTICVIVEDDSYYTSMNRILAAVNVGISNANTYILPKNLRVQAVFQSAGPSCTRSEYTAASNVYKLLSSGVRCDIFLGGGCPSTASSLYAVADSLNLLFIGNPAAGVNAFSLDATQDYFPLIIKIAFEFGDLTDFIQIYFKRHNYRHFAMLRDEASSFASLLVKSILFNFRTDDRELAEHCTELPFSSQRATRSVYERLLSEASGRARVFGLFAHANVVREIMITAHTLGLTVGEYVFIAIELYDLAYWGKIDYVTGGPTDMTAKEAYRSLLIFSLHSTTRSVFYNEFDEKVKSLSQLQYNYTFNPMEKLDLIITSAYEAVIMYALEIKNMSNLSLDYRNGSLICRRIRGNSYNVNLGILHMGDDGQRDMDYDVKVQMTYFQHPDTPNDSIRLVRDLHWPNNPIGDLPTDEPKCGFLNDKCKDEQLTSGALAAAVIVPLIFLIGFGSAATVTYLKLRSLHQEYNPDWWKLNTEEVIVKQTRTTSVAVSKKTGNSRSTLGTSNATGYSSYMCDILASYKGTLVMLTDVTTLAKHITPELVGQVAKLKVVTHHNLQTFVGITVNQQNICEFIVSEVCAKGSLTDVLDNDIYKLDWSFKNTLIRDIVFGMTQIHTSGIISHGKLDSHTCLIDSRFSLKISDYGLPFFRNSADLQPPKISDPNDINVRNYETLLWRAPEFLRQTMPPAGTQRGDVYSFAIILQQIILRSGPYELPSEPMDISTHEIVKEVINSNVPPVRPRVPRVSCSNELYDLMERCWEEIPLERPTFPKIKERLKKVIGDVGDNIVDVLFKRMEQYASDLEFKVAEKTRQFMDEKTRSESLLSQLLPVSVAAALMRGEHVDPEAFSSVTIYFSDIVGFTTISAAGSPMDVVGLLNSLYTFFDGILEKFDVYKVETIGDAYMVASGLPVRNGNKHAAEISRMSLTLVNGIVNLIVPNRPSEKLEVRIGINSGPCVAGIVGMKMPRYCLFGDTVNVASRMESTGEPMKIQISDSTKELLDNIGGFRIVERGPVSVKGKGILTTYWLLS